MSDRWPDHRSAFDSYIETQLAPTLRKGDVVILDNPTVHNSERPAQCLKRHGAWLVCLSAYSSDFDTIELALGKIKAHLRKARARTLDALWCTFGDSCNLFEPQKCWNFLKAAGYASVYLAGAPGEQVLG